MKLFTGIIFYDDGSFTNYEKATVRTFLDMLLRLKNVTKITIGVNRTHREMLFMKETKKKVE